MRLNTPVTNIEYELNDSDTIVSTTDLQGNIIYANPYFILVSGYSQAELIGAPQNILRHPDMPAEAFADFWRTIKNGRPWTGMVKNRRRNGDFYWVMANVTPVIENGRPVGYMSVRTKPSRKQVQDAAVLYQAIRDGNPNRIAICNGAAVRSGVAARLAALGHISLEQRIGWNLSLLICALAGLTAANLFLHGATAGAGRAGLAGLSTAAIAVAGYFWYSLYKGVITPLKQALRASQIMAGGDLTQNIGTDRNDDIGQLLRSMRQIIDSVQGVSAIMSEIATASREQNSGIAQVNAAVAQMDQVTQQNAALVEQAAAAAASLEDQTASVLQALTVFKLDRRKQVAAI